MNTMNTDQQAVRAALAVTFSASSAVRSLPAAERTDPAAMLRAVHGAIDGELWHDIPFPAMRDLLVSCADAAWKGGITTVPEQIGSPDAAEMLRLTGLYLAEGDLLAPEGYGALLIIGDPADHHRRARDAVCVLLVLVILGEKHIRRPVYDTSAASYDQSVLVSVADLRQRYEDLTEHDFASRMLARAPATGDPDPATLRVRDTPGR